VNDHVYNVVSLLAGITKICTLPLHMYKMQKHVIEYQVCVLNRPVRFFINVLILWIIE